MADLTLTDGAYRALLIPDPRFTYEALDLSASTVTQEGARAGVPEPVRSTRGVLEATGEQDAETLTITATRGGFAREISGAAFTWESTGVAGEIGWEGPTAINDLAPVVVNTPTYGRDLATAPAVLALPDGRVITAFNRQSSSTLDKTSTRTRLPDGTWLSPVDVGLTSETTGANRNRCALAWDDSRQEARLYVLWRDVTVAFQGRARLSLYTSDDGGVSWALTQDDCLTTPMDWSGTTTGYDVTGISLALAGGALGSLLISVTSNDSALDLLSTVIQYASGDGGFTFDLVEAYAPIAANDALGGVSFTVYADPGGSLGFRAVWSSATSADVGTIYGADLGSPYTPWSAVTGAAVADLGSAISSITAKVLAPVAVAVAVDPIGAVWAYYSPSTATSQRVVVLQISAGGTGRTIGDVAGLTTPWAFGPLTAAEGLEEIAATFTAGGVVLIGRLQSATSSAYVGALIAFTLGGYTGATRRPVTFGAALGDYNAPYEVDWYGIAAFGDFTPWAAVVSGTPALSLNTSLGFVVDCSGSILDTYQATYTPTNAGAAQGHAQIIAQVTAGTADLTVKSYGVVTLRLRISASQIVVRDMDTGSTLETITLPSSGAHIVRVSWNRGGSGLITWRVEVAPWTVGATVRSWDAYTGTTLAWFFSGGDYCRLDVNNAGIGVFYHLAFAAGDQGAGMAEDTLTPRPFSLTPAPVYHGVNVALTAGPVVGGDSWTIAPWYDFGVRRVFQEIEPSPRAKFKTTANASASSTSLVFNLTDGGQAVRLGAPVIGVGFFGANFRTAQIQTATSSGGPWTTIRTVDLSHGLSGLAWERKGYTVAAPASTPDTGPHYIAENALAGGTFLFDSGVAARILRNTDGVWQNGADVKRPRLTLDSAPPDTSGSAGVIVYPNGVALIYGLQDVQYLRVRIPAQSTPSGVLELGSLVFGRVQLLAKQYGRGRSREFVPSVDTFTAANGARRTRTLAPQRQIVTVNWQENAIDTRGVYSDPGSASYVRAAAGLAPAAYVAATADQIRGLLGQLDGAPLVYISKLTPDQPPMVPPYSFLRGRVLDPLVIDAVQGDEEEDEVVRIAGITVEEEL